MNCARAFSRKKWVWRAVGIAIFRYSAKELGIAYRKHIIAVFLSMSLGFLTGHIRDFFLPLASLIRSSFNFLIFRPYISFELRRERREKKRFKNLCTKNLKIY